MTSDDVSRMSKKELEREVRKLRSNVPDTNKKTELIHWLYQVRDMGGFPAVTEEFCKLYAENRRLIGVLEDAYGSSYNQAKQVDETMRRYRTLFHDLYESGRRLALSSAAIVAAHDATNKAFVDSQTALRREIEQDGMNYDPGVNPEACMTEIIFLSQLFGASVVYLSAYDHALAINDEPHFVAERILQETRSYGEPSIATVQRLPLNWLAENFNLNKPPAKHTTLREGLIWIERERRSGLTREEFCERPTELGMPPDTSNMRKYQRWWNALENAANLKPEIPLLQG